MRCQHPVANLVGPRIGVEHERARRRIRGTQREDARPRAVGRDGRKRRERPGRPRAVERAGDAIPDVVDPCAQVASRGHRGAAKRRQAHRRYTPCFKLAAMKSSTSLALGAAPAPGVCARGPGLSALRRPAADPRGGDRAPRGPGAARRAAAGRYAAAPRCRHRPVTRRRSQRPRGRGSPALPAVRPGVSATSSGVCSAPAARAARALAGPTRGALDSGHLLTRQPDCRRPWREGRKRALDCPDSPRARSVAGLHGHGPGGCRALVL